MNPFISGTQASIPDQGLKFLEKRGTAQSRAGWRVQGSGVWGGGLCSSPLLTSGPNGPSVG